MWFYTSGTRTSDPRSYDSKLTMLAPRIFRTEEEAKSYACRMVIKKIELSKNTKATHAIIAAGPELLRNYELLCNMAREEKWFLGCWGHDTFVWGIEKMYMTRMEVDDGWHLAAWEKNEYSDYPKRLQREEMEKKAIELAAEQKKMKIKEEWEESKKISREKMEKFDLKMKKLEEMKKAKKEAKKKKASKK